MEIQLRGRQQAAQQVPIHRRLRSHGGGGDLIVIAMMMLRYAVDGGALERRHVGEELHVQLGLSHQAAVVMHRTGRHSSSAAAAVHQ